MEANQALASRFVCKAGGPNAFDLDAHCAVLHLLRGCDSQRFLVEPRLRQLSNGAGARVTGLVCLPCSTAGVQQAAASVNSSFLREGTESRARSEPPEQQADAATESVGCKEICITRLVRLAAAGCSSVGLSARCWSLGSRSVISLWIETNEIDRNSVRLGELLRCGRRTDIRKDPAEASSRRNRLWRIWTREIPRRPTRLANAGTAPNRYRERSWQEKGRKDNRRPKRCAAAAMPR